MKTITVQTIYLIIASAINISLIVTWTILYHRHMQKEIAKQKRRLERRRGKIFDPVTRGGGYQPYPTKNENKCNPTEETMKPTIALNIFTNCTSKSPDTTIIKKTFDSFIDTFGEIETTVYCDTHPNGTAFNKYIDNMSDLDIADLYWETESLSDGYIKSIKRAHTDYLFQLEGDWTFIKNNIEHTLDEILECMFTKNIYHFRFNKRANQIAVWDKKMEPRIYAGENFNLQYCESNNMSNNPHIIDVKKYREEIAKHIKIKPGSKGIEEELNAQNKYISCIYGGVGYPATVAHLDGRRSK